MEELVQLLDELLAQIGTIVRVGSILRLQINMAVGGVVIKDKRLDVAPDLIEDWLVLLVGFCSLDEGQEFLLSDFGDEFCVSKTQEVSTVLEEGGHIDKDLVDLVLGKAILLQEILYLCGLG